MTPQSSILERVVNYNWKGGDTKLLLNEPVTKGSSGSKMKHLRTAPYTGFFPRWGGSKSWRSKGQEGVKRDYLTYE